RNKCEPESEHGSEGSERRDAMTEPAKCVQCGHKNHVGRVCPEQVMVGVFCYCGVAPVEPQGEPASKPTKLEVPIQPASFSRRTGRGSSRWPQQAKHRRVSSSRRRP